MGISAQEAGIRVNRSKQAIIKAIKKGNVSAIKNENGEWDIEPAELFRVYKPVHTVSSKKVDEGSQRDIPVIPPDTQLENARLQAELNAAQEMIEILKADKVFLQDELKKSSTLVADMRFKQTEKPAQSNKRLLLVETYQ